MSRELSLFLGSKIWKITPQDIITLESLNIFKNKKRKIRKQMTSLSGYVKHIRKHVSIFLRCLSQHNILFLAFTYICFVDPPYYV